MIEGARLYLQSVRNADLGIELLGIDRAGELAGLIATEPSQYTKGEPGAERLLCYWIDDQFSGQGIATQAVRLVIADCAARSSVKSLAATCFANNPASIRVLEKTGFRLVRQWQFECHHVFETHQGKTVQLYRRFV